MQGRRAGRARLVILATAGVVSVACVALVALWTMRHSSSPLKVDPIAVEQSKNFAERLRELRRASAGDESGPEGVPLARTLAGRIDRALEAEGQELAVLEAPGTPDAPRERMEAARRVVARVLAQGGAADARALANAATWDPPLDAVRLLDSPRDESGDVRRIARLHAARLALAQQDGQVEEWTLAYEQMLRLAQVQGRGATVHSALNAYAVLNLAYERARAMIESGIADAQVLARVQELTERSPPPPLSVAMEGERIIAEDALDYLVRSPDGAGNLATRDGPTPARGAQLRVPDTRSIAPGLPARPVHITMVARAFDVLGTHAELSAAERARDRDGGAKLARMSEGSLLLSMLLPPEQALGAYDQSRADFEGVRTLLALERFRLRTGALAQALDDLVPDFLPDVPVGPYAGLPLGYAVRPDAPHGFVLWAAGMDMDNDGGKVDFDDPYSVQRAGADGDFLLNR